MPSPLPNKIETVFAASLVTARSSRPSPLKSPANRNIRFSRQCIGWRREESAVAVAKEHRNATGRYAGSVRKAGGDGQVEPAVPMKVASLEFTCACVPTLDQRRASEGAVAVAHQDRDAAVTAGDARSRCPSPLKSPATTASGR